MTSRCIYYGRAKSKRVEDKMENVFKIKIEDFNKNLESIYKFVKEIIYDGKDYFFYELNNNEILEGFYLQEKGIIEVECGKECPAKLLNKLEKLSIKK